MEFFNSTIIMMWLAISSVIAYIVLSVLVHLKRNGMLDGIEFFRDKKDK